VVNINQVSSALDFVSILYVLSVSNVCNSRYMHSINEEDISVLLTEVYSDFQS
jgi:hypothetical protein